MNKYSKDGVCLICNQKIIREDGNCTCQGDFCCEAARVIVNQFLLIPNKEEVDGTKEIR